MPVRRMAWVQKTHTSDAHEGMASPPGPFCVFHEAGRLAFEGRFPACEVQDALAECLDPFSQRLGQGLVRQRQEVCRFVRRFGQGSGEPFVVRIQDVVTGQDQARAVE
jgi:hypothetical protein